MGDGVEKRGRPSEKREVPREDVVALARGMVRSLPDKLRERLEHMDKDRMPKRMKQDLVASILLGAMEQPVFLEALAEDMLQNPIQMAKLQVALVPKNVTVESDVRVQHTIVVPETQTTAQWMEARGITGTETRDELGFEHVTVEVEDAD